jgi:hypothetical protein
LVPTDHWARHVVKAGRLLTVDELPDNSWEGFDELDADFFPVPLTVEDVAEWELDRTCLGGLVASALGLDARLEQLSEQFLLIGHARRDVPLVLGFLSPHAASRGELVAMRASLPTKTRGVVVISIGYEPTLADQVEFERHGIVVGHLADALTLRPSLQACVDSLVAKSPLGTLEPESGFLLAFDARSAHLGLRTFSFSAMEGAAISVLLHAYMAGQPWVHQLSLLAEIESKSTTLASLFKRNPAFGTLIQGDGEGRFRLDFGQE